MEIRSAVQCLKMAKTQRVAAKWRARRITQKNRNAFKAVDECG